MHVDCIFCVCVCCGVCEAFFEPLYCFCFAVVVAATTVTTTKKGCLSLLLLFFCAVWFTCLSLYIYGHCACACFPSCLLCIFPSSSSAVCNPLSKKKANTVTW